MKKVYLNAWAAKNLGDDLFIKIISDRYKNDFYLVSVKNYPKINKNMHIYNDNNLLLRCYRKFNKIFLKRTFSLREKIKSNKDIVITIGGSLFIENSNMEVNKKYLKSLVSEEKPYYVLGSNIGPYFSEEYIPMVEDIVVKNAKDICFRDNNSKKLINQENVRVAPDIVFSLEKDRYIRNTEKKVVISVINCKEKSSQIGFDYTKQYEEKIIEIINYYLEKEYKITLMSFCTLEKDTETITSLMKQINNNSKISKYIYDGNIEEALKVLASSEIIIGSRFHANILGLIFNKKILPISYNNKTINTLKDIGFKGKIVKLNEISKFECEELEKIEQEKIDLNMISKKSEEHFKKIDEILERR